MERVRQIWPVRGLSQRNLYCIVCNSWSQFITEISAVLSVLLSTDKCNFLTMRKIHNKTDIAKKSVCAHLQIQM